MATAIVTGAAGQDGYLLTQRLLAEGFEVHATVHTQAGRDLLSDLARSAPLIVHHADFRDPTMLADLVADVRPDELYNLAGQSSVAKSFAAPSDTWRTNADAVAVLLEGVRLESPDTRVYQSSSSEMFGSVPGEAVVHDEHSPLRPQSPYAAAKCAAHLLCEGYRRAYGLRIACGILFNHESRRRPQGFLTRKVVDHVTYLRRSPDELHDAEPLVVGNLAAQRDWGFAPDYVDGIVRVVRQIAIRAETLRRAPEEDTGHNYRDYVLGSGAPHAVWELIDRSFSIAGFQLDWDRTSSDPAQWSATFLGTAIQAVRVDPTQVRPSDPSAIIANPARARRELSWHPRHSMDTFLLDMLNA